MKSSAHLRPKTGKKLCKRPCFCYYRRNGGVYMEGWRKDARHEPIIVDLEALVPKEHLLRKIEKVMDYEWLYERLDPYYCHDNGRPGTDPVVLVKMVLIQHLFGIPSLRQTYREIQVNNAYRWFLGYGLLDNIPHFATVSYAFCQRFPDELTSEIIFYMIKATGEFKTMHVRSCFASQKPYPTLSEVAKNQREFHFANTYGTVIAVWCPRYVNGINLPGWHFHYLSGDKTQGGHIWGLSADHLTLKINQIERFDLTLPRNPEFAQRDLCEDLSAKTAAVEGVKK